VIGVGVLAVLALAAIWASTALAGGAADSVTTVTMGKPGEFSMKPSAASAKAGEVELILRNRGKIAHEFILLKTNIKASRLPARAENPNKVEEPGFSLEIEDIEPGGKVIVALPLKKGHYVILCNIDNHYQGGMRADLTLK
jgi:uncharacterized cupredoxin-like copper-binding protein